MMIVLVAALTFAAIHDARTKRIPNWLTFSLMAVGLAMQATQGAGLEFGLIGLAAAFAIHFPLWGFFKLEGAGDAKLMMGVGAIMGWQEMIEATLWRYVLQVPYAVIVITVMGRWANFKSAVLWTLAKARGLDPGERPESKELPFGPVLALAVVAAYLSDWLDFFQ